jgi:hypothetical protein
MCRHGLHASRRILDALQYATGPIVCRVVISGDIIEGTDKLVGTSRYIEWTLDATWYLHEFACACAETALRRVNVTDTRLWNAVAKKRQWLNGEVSDDELAAAESAARSAAWSAGKNAARSAAWSAAWSAAESAAKSAARSAAWSAAWSAAKSAAEKAAGRAAWDSARRAQNRTLTTMLNSAD